ncbi:MAG: TetR/AcrR family transcriptional regulator [Mycobacterium sp.]
MAKKPAPPKRPSARERLLAASDELFYRDGVHSTGIDAVIEKAGVAKGSLYYIFGGKDELIAAYLRGRHESWRNQVEERQRTVEDPAEKILVMFDAIGDYAALPDYRGDAFANASAEAPAGSAQELATKNFREWLRGSLHDLASQTGVIDPEALVDALVVLHDGAMATAMMDNTSRGTAKTARRIAQLTLAAAKASSSV